LGLLVWQAAGASKRWEDIEFDVRNVRYKTTTMVNIGVPMSQLLSLETRALLDEDVGAKGLGRSMGLVPFDKDRANEELPSRSVIAYCDEIDIKVCVTDNVSGKTEECLLDITLPMRTYANRPFASITSELSSEKHTELVEKLVQRLQATELHSRR
jgi:hypothetical protein